MTQQRIIKTFHNIEACRKSGYILEALLRNYHLNIQLMLLMMSHVKPDYAFENKKFKVLAREFQHEIDTNPDLKSIINKKTFRMVKTWLAKMDSFFKELKFKQPDNTRLLFAEAEKIFGILNISANKLFIRKKI